MVYLLHELRRYSGTFSRRAPNTMSELTLELLPATVVRSRALYAAEPGLFTSGLSTVWAVHSQAPLTTIWKLRIGVHVASKSAPSTTSFWPVVRQRSKRPLTKVLKPDGLM